MWDRFATRRKVRRVGNAEPPPAPSKGCSVGKPVPDGTELARHLRPLVPYTAASAVPTRTAGLRRRKCRRSDRRIFLRRKLRSFGEALLGGSDYFLDQRIAAAIEDEHVLRFPFEAVEDDVLAQEFWLVRDF